MTIGRMKLELPHVFWFSFLARVEAAVGAEGAGGRGAAHLHHLQ